MTGYSTHPTMFAKRFGEESGIVQVYYPGPVATYKRTNGQVIVRLYHNGNARQAEELHRRMLDDMQKT